MYPFDNNIPAYPFDKNKYVDSSELVDFNATSSVDRMKELDTQIAELKQKIAQKKAASLQSKYDRMNDPDYKVARYDYIVSGDRSGLDRISEAERAYKNMLSNQAHALKLAKAQRLDSQLYQMDEYMKNRSIAATKAKYAEDELAEANRKNDNAAIALAKQNKAIADAELAYWNKRVGFNPDAKTDNTPQVNTPQGNTPNSNDNHLGDFNLSTFVTNLKAIKDFATNAEKAKKLKEIEAIEGWKQNDDLVEQWNILNKIVSKEQRKINADNKLAELQKEYDDIKSPFERKKWLNSHSKVIAKGNKLQYKK